MPRNGRCSVIEFVGTTGLLEERLNQACDLGAEIIAVQAVDSNFLHPHAFPRTGEQHDLGQEATERSVRKHTWVITAFFPNENDAEESA